MQFVERSQEFLTYFLFKSQWNVVSEQKLDNMLMVHRDSAFPHKWGRRTDALKLVPTLNWHKESLMRSRFAVS
jgi:hypothetical protein